MLIFCRIWLVIASLGALAILGFFAWGLSDGTVSSFNAGIWSGLVMAALAVPIAGAVLHARGFRWISLIVLSVLAVPALLYALFILLILIFQPRWN